MENKTLINHKNGNDANRLLAAVKSYYWLQWKEPKRFLLKGFGLTIWKWCGVFIPCCNIWLGDMRHIGYDIFHNGVGFSIHLPPFIIIDICVSGKIGWWYKKGIFRIRVHKWEWCY